MKRPFIQLLTVLFCCAIVFTSCELNAANQNGDHAGDYEEMSMQEVAEEGTVTGKTLNLSPFTGIALTTSYNVHLKQGSTQSVSIEASQKVIDNLSLKVKNGIWTIKSKKNKWSWKDQGKVDIYITIPKVTFLSVTGSGNIKGKNHLDVNNLKTVVTGSGNIHADISGDNVKSVISGSGNINLSGTASALAQTITGSGDLKAKGLKVNNAEIKITGSGTCKIHVSSNLDVRITGSGDVYYMGSPNVHSKVTGSGDVRSI